MLSGQAAVTKLHVFSKVIPVFTQAGSSLYSSVLNRPNYSIGRAHIPGAPMWPPIHVGCLAAKTRSLICMFFFFQITLFFNVPGLFTWYTEHCILYTIHTVYCILYTLYTVYYTN